MWNMVTVSVLVLINDQKSVFAEYYIVTVKLTFDPLDSSISPI